MGERKHKVESGEKKEKANLGLKTSQQVTNPILQLQRLVGNKTVTNMIQRHYFTNLEIELRRPNPEEPAELGNVGYTYPAGSTARWRRCEEGEGGGERRGS